MPKIACVPDLAQFRRSTGAPLDDLELRLENWGRCLRGAGLRFDVVANGYVGAIECHHGDWYRSPQVWHAPPPGAGIRGDVHDAAAIERAVCAAPLFDHLLLKGWYVRRWHPGKCLRMAQKGANATPVRGTFDGYLNRAHAALRLVLDAPAVVRKQHAGDLCAAVVGPYLTQLAMVA